MPATIDAMREATVIVPGTPIENWARYALILRPGQDPIAVRARVEADLQPLAAQVGSLSALDSRTLVVALPERVLRADDRAAFTAAYALADDFDLEAAEPDLPTDLFPEPPPPEPGEEGVEGFPPGCVVPGQPHLDQEPRWALAAMRVPQAWEFSTGRQRPSQGEGVVIAQPDTGVTRHAELDGVRTVSGFNVLAGTPDPTDPLDDSGNPGHGTATASVVVSPAAGVVTGSAPQARHMPIRAIQSVVRLSQVSVARGIDWAVEHGAQVITMSLGGIFSFSLHRAIKRAVRADVLVLAAAGNCVRFVVWPARFDECLAVAGTSSTDRIWQGSCRGGAVDIAAPGQNVIRASVPPGAGPGGSLVGQGQGTSYAVALTAGVAALWLAHHGREHLIAQARERGETLQTMFRRLVRATARRPAGWDPSDFGAGIVDARALLEAELDLGRGQESVAGLMAPAGGPEGSVESLVAESAGPEAVGADAARWHRFGPELSTLLLRQRLPGSEESVAGPEVSESLAAAVVNPRLRDQLRLDPGGGPVREHEISR
jgi:hypothetical protein